MIRSPLRYRLGNQTLCLLGSHKGGKKHQRLVRKGQTFGGTAHLTTQPLENSLLHRCHFLPPNNNRFLSIESEKNRSDDNGMDGPHTVPSLVDKPTCQSVSAMTSFPTRTTSVSNNFWNVSSSQLTFTIRRGRPSLAIVSLCFVFQCNRRQTCCPIWIRFYSKKVPLLSSKAPVASN